MTVELCTCKVPVPDKEKDPRLCINCGKMTPIAARKAPGPIAGRITTMPRCIGCGTAVAEGANLCVVCADKPQYQAPQATRQVGAQPTPAYQAPQYEGNFRRQQRDEDQPK